MVPKSNYKPASQTKDQDTFSSWFYEQRHWRFGAARISRIFRRTIDIQGSQVQLRISYSIYRPRYILQLLLWTETLETQNSKNTIIDQWPLVKKRYEDLWGWDLPPSRTVKRSYMLGPGASKRDIEFRNPEPEQLNERSEFREPAYWKGALEDCLSEISKDQTEDYYAWGTA